MGEEPLVASYLTDPCHNNQLPTANNNDDGDDDDDDDDDEEPISYS